MTVFRFRHGYALAMKKRLVLIILISLCGGIFGSKVNKYTWGSWSRVSCARSCDQPSGTASPVRHCQYCEDRHRKPCIRSQMKQCTHGSSKKVGRRRLVKNVHPAILIKVTTHRMNTTIQTQTDMGVVTIYTCIIKSRWEFSKQARKRHTKYKNNKRGVINIEILQHIRGKIRKYVSILNPPNMWVAVVVFFISNAYYCHLHILDYDILHIMYNLRYIHKAKACTNTVINGH